MVRIRAPSNLFVDLIRETQKIHQLSHFYLLSLCTQKYAAGLRAGVGEQQSRRLHSGQHWEDGETLNELILMNDNLTGCLPPQIGMLKELTVFDVSFNNLQGPLSAEISRMRKLEQLDVAHNRLTGVVPATVCQLPRLKNFTYSYNYFTGEAPQCSRFGGGAVSDGKENCLPEKSRFERESSFSLTNN